MRPPDRGISSTSGVRLRSYAALPPAEFAVSSLLKFPRSPALFLGGLALILAVLACYHHTLGAPFVLDDNSSIRNNPSIRQLWPLQAPAIGGMRGRPFVNFTLALNHALGGTAVAGYHWFNLAIHAASALVLAGVVRRTLLLPIFQGGRLAESAPLIAFSAALLWAVHPLNTEAVTYLSQRTESLMGLLYLFTLYCFVRSVPADHPRPWRLLALASCLAGMACKEVMITAPLLVLLFDRTFVAGNFRAAWRARGRFHLALASSWLVLAWLMRGLGERGVGFTAGVSAWRYALTESGVVLNYFKLALWPAPLVFDYGSETAASLAEVWPGALLLVAGLAGVAWTLRHRPLPGFLLAWPFVILAPTSSFVPVALQPMAEHRMYVPLAGLAVLAVAGLHGRLGRKLWIVVLPAALALGLATHRRNALYREETSLWGDTVEKRPANERAQVNLGLALLNSGRDAEARAHFERALALDPTSHQALCNLGFLHARAGRPAEAIACFQQSLRLNPAFAEAHYNLGCVLLAAGKNAEARAEFEAAIRLNPDYGDAHNNLAVILADARNYADAVTHYSAALTLNPADAELRANRAYAHFRLGRVSAAIADYEQALQLRPNFTDARRNLEILRAIKPGARP